MLGNPDNLYLLPERFLFLEAGHRLETFNCPVNTWEIKKPKKS